MQNSIRYVIYTSMVVIQIVLSLTSYIPQIVKLIKRKSSDDISLSSWIIGLFDYLTYQILLIVSDAGLILNMLNILQTLQITTIIILIKIYQQKEENEDIGN